MVFKLKPRNDIFFTYFDQLSDAILDAANFLLQFIEQPGENPSQKLEAINQVEERGDRILSEVMAEINSSFVTPSSTILHVKFCSN